MARVLLRVFLIVVLFVSAFATSACRKRAPGTCAEDIDCAPGHECRHGTCVKRERLRFGETKPSPTPPQADPSPVDPFAKPDAAVASPDASPNVPQPRQPPPKPVPDSPAPTPPPPSQEPLWKQRLKNT